MSISRVEKYCCGCGLCNNWVEGRYDARGFFRPGKDLDKSGFDTSICYCNSLTGSADSALWWGPVKSAIYSCSTDSAMRRKASSGGTLTALCDYMLESGTVDGVIQVSRDPDSQIRTKSILSESPADVANCVGSRYTGSAVLSGLFESAERGKRYAVVGKPCDTRVLRAWLAKHEGWKATFPYLLSFFCGGTPTRQANERLLAKLQVDESDLADFWYRGHGWPGRTTAVRRDGSLSSMDYEVSWNQILGRDVQEICRFCWEGTGEAADVSCGDGWHVQDGRPLFEEAPGRNVTLVRTDAGAHLLENAIAAGALEVEPIDDLSILGDMQPGQHVRKAAMASFILAMRLACKETPRYSLSEISRWSSDMPLSTRCLMFLGTLKRIARGKIS